jgi:hypothetical protein
MPGGMAPPPHMMMSGAAVPGGIPGYNPFAGAVAGHGSTGANQRELSPPPSRPALAPLFKEGDQ